MHTRPCRPHQAGFSAVKLVALIVIMALAAPPLGLLLHEALADNTQVQMTVMAASLAQGLLEEILAKGYEDPESAPGSFGREESCRAEYDDVDDYDGIDERPPCDSRGHVLAQYAAFRVRVAVENIGSADKDGPALPSGSTPCKRVTVIAGRDEGAGTVRLVGLISNLKDIETTPAPEPAHRSNGTP